MGVVRVQGFALKEGGGSGGIVAGMAGLDFVTAAKQPLGWGIGFREGWVFGVVGREV